MRRKIASRLWWVAGAVAVAAPILAALYLAHSRSMDQEARQASTMAGEVLRRVEAAGDQAVGALVRLQALPRDAPCSDAAIERMRDIDLASSYLQAVGHVEGGRLACSSLSPHGDGIALGPVSSTSARGTKVRPSVDLGLGAGKRFLVLEEDGFAVAVHPEAFTDVFVENADLSLGVVGRSTGLVLASRGAFDPRPEKRLRGTRKQAYFNGRHLVAVRHSQAYDVVTYAAMPVAHLRRQLYASAALLVPIGLLAAAAIAFAWIRVARQQASLPAVLRGALARGEFALHYQPIVELGTQRVVGVEALVRWPQADGSYIRPDVFIPVAEDCEMIRGVTDFVLRQVAEDAGRVLAGWPDGYISINLSSADLHDGALDALRRLTDSAGMRPQNLVVEVTEHSMLDFENARRVIHDVRALGIRVAIDDFGTGFSGLSYLTRLETDFLKIDKAFIETVGTDSVTSQVAPHIVRIAQSLGLETIGEGVETDVQAAFLQEHGVRYAQGWLFGKAMPVEALVEYLAAKR
jgi:sensor c-di-GMP phosphodiesterase-like protein